MWRHLKTVITFCFSDTFMAHNLYRGFAIQNTFMSTAIIGRMVLQRHYPLNAILLTSLSIFAQLPTLRWNIFLTKALLALWVIPNSFSRFCSQNGYLNSKLMLRWDGHFKRLADRFDIQQIRCAAPRRCAQCGTSARGPKPVSEGKATQWKIREVHVMCVMWCVHKP